MSKFINQIKQPTSCYTCEHNNILHDDEECEVWECSEIYGIAITTNPPYDEPCDFYQKAKEHE